MIRKIIIALAILIPAVSCKTGGKKGMTPLQYNEFISKLETSLKPEIDETERRIAGFNSNQQYDSIRVAGIHMERLVDSVVNQLQKTEVPDGKEALAFRDASIHYFRFIGDAYRIYEEYGTAATDGDRQKKLNELMEKVGHKEEESLNIGRAQQAFARVSGFKVQ